MEGTTMAVIIILMDDDAPAEKPYINPNQHCTNEECPYTTFSHTGRWCGYEQTRQCDCHWDYPERGQL